MYFLSLTSLGFVLIVGLALLHWLRQLNPFDYLDGEWFTSGEKFPSVDSSMSLVGKSDRGTVEISVCSSFELPT